MINVYLLLDWTKFGFLPYMLLNLFPKLTGLKALAFASFIYHFFL